MSDLVPQIGWLLVAPALAAAPGYLAPRLGSAEARALRAPLAASALLAAPLVAWIAPGIPAGEAFALLWLLVAALVDYRHRIVPDRWTLVGLGGAVLLLLVTRPDALGVQALWALGGGGIMLGLRWLGLLVAGAPGVGMGDVKAALVLGLFLGGLAVPLLWLGMTLCGILAIGGRLSGRLPRGGRLPLLPFLLAAALIVIACGGALYDLLAWIAV